MKKSPRISVVMPVYNAGRYVADAIESILRQTMQDFEFIIVDDASTDNSWAILKKYQAKYPTKIKIYRNDKNLKATETVERAMMLATGDFLARMDADDVSLPQRLEKQLSYLEKHPKTIAVGGQCILIDQDGKSIGEKRFPLTFKEIYDYIFQFCPVQQPALMIARKRLPKNFSFYNSDMAPVEDVELLFRLFQRGKVENLPDYVLLYRIHGKNSSLMNLRKSFFLTLLSRIRGVLFYDYQPTVKGVLMTLAQSMVVLLLPQTITYWMYSVARRIMAQRPPLLLSLQPTGFPALA